MDKGHRHGKAYRDEIPQDGVLKTLFYKAITLQSYREHYSFIKSRTWNISEYDLNQGVAALCRKVSQL